MARYPTKISELPYVTAVVDHDKTWGVFTSNGGVATYSKIDNPEPKKGDGCRLYKKPDGTEGLFLIKNPDEVYDIILEADTLLNGARSCVSRLSEERKNFDTLELFQRT